MNLESRITWQKLSLELELLSSEDPATLVPLIIGLNSALWPEPDYERLHRTVNFMTYEIISKAEGYEESDRYQILNDYFFDQKGFQFTLPTSSSNNPSDLLLEPILQNKKGESLPLSVLYQHFANHLDLPIYLVNMSSMLVMKWVRGGKSSFLHLFDHGKVLDAGDLTHFIQAEVQNRKLNEESVVEILPSRQVFQKYTERLLECYQVHEKNPQTLILLNVLLLLNPHCMTSLGTRALLQQELGHTREALCDYKKYFSYVDMESAPTKIQTAYRKLKSIEKLNNSPSVSPLIH